MQTDRQSVYQDWLFERGIMESPVANAAGVFLHEIAADHSILIVAEISEKDSDSDRQLLRRLSVAVGDKVSVVGSVEINTVPWHVLLDTHRSIKNLILLGDTLKESLTRSGADLKFGLNEDRIMIGPTPILMSTDVATKRKFWLDLKTRLTEETH